MQFKTFKTTFDKCEKKPLARTTGSSYENGKLDINTSDILTKLIQDTGRFCERYASDLFIGWKEVEGTLDNITPESMGAEYVFVFGIRESGVDGNNFVLSRLRNTLYAGKPYVSTSEYRRILGLKVAIDTETCSVPYVTMELKNLTHEFLHMENEDIPSWDNLQKNALKSRITNDDLYLSEFLGYEVDPDEDTSVTDNRLEQRIEQMSRTELMGWVKRLRVDLPGCMGLISFG